MKARGFAKRVNKWGTGIELGIAKASGEYATQFYRALLNATPVDTGFARAGWDMEVGSGTVMGPPASPQKKDRNATYLRPQVPRHRFTKIRPISITNDTPYIGVLNKRVGIVNQAKGATAGLLKRLLKANAPK